MIGTKSMAPLAWILGMQLLLVLPFVGQPIHLDDHIYVDIGRNVVSSQGHPHDFPYCFEGACAPDMASHSHPPFVGYWIGLLLWLFGDGPRLHIMLHLGFLVFPLLFAVGMYRLALRFTWSPVLATLVAITSPAAVVISHNLMADYPTMAMWTMALALYVDGVDQRNSKSVWISGIFLALAAFSSYPALMATGICWIYAWLKRSRMPAAFLAPSVAIVWMAGWLIYSSVYFDRFVLGGTASYFLDAKGSLTVAALTGKLLGLPISLAGVLVLPVPLVRRALDCWKGRPAIGWIVISAALAQYYAPDYAAWERLLVGLFLAIGGCILLGMFLCLSESLASREAPDLGRDALFLAAWVAGVIAALLLVYSHASARYILPLLPPIVLLAFLKFPRPVEPAVRWPLVAGLSVALILGLSLSVADFATARVYRDIAESMGESLDGWEDQTRFGGEWGFRYYMLEQGFRQFVADSDDIAAGEFVITPQQAVPYNPPQDVRTMLVPVAQPSWVSSFPVQLMNQASHAGFYSSGWGLLPFSLSRAPVEAVTVQQVNYLVEKLPEITLEHESDLATIIPRPAPSGGVELVVPVPGTMSIPYDGPWPAEVQFTCLWANQEQTPPCPIRAFYDRNDIRSELELQSGNFLDGTGESVASTSFQLTEGGPGMIVLEMNDLDASVNGNQIVLRNWLMLPPGGLR